MKLDKNYFFTLREDAKDEDSTSGNLLVRSGMIKKVGAGIYMYLPLGLRVLDKIKKIIKEEMDAAGAMEVLMPSLIPREYYEKCGRVEAFGDSMFKLHDRKNTNMVLGPTHEELFAIAASMYLKSYKDLPFNLYQQADKFRDEIRPRYALIRVKEFIMKDAYTFDRDEEMQNESYQKMYDAYCNVFDRMDINYKIVKASVGAMGGTLSEEYQAITDIGEDILVLCDKCEYASNMEVASYKILDVEEEEKEMEMVHTPDAHTIEDVIDFLNVDIKHTVKALLMHVDGKLTIFFVRGDRSLNEEKALKLMGGKEIGFANDEQIAESNAAPGYTGPVGLTGCTVVVDEEVLHMKNFVCGANKTDYHYINANVKDINYDIVGDIANVVEGDICPKCGGNIYFKHGIEIGNLFKLGDHYCRDLGITYLDENNQEQYPIMGSYGIGPGRILASIIEQNNDENGMILPMNIAPYQVSLVQINMKDKTQTKLAEKIYNDLTKKGIEVIYDNRDERAGVKFKDMDLIGIPLRITVGKKAEDGIVEWKERRNDTTLEVSSKDVVKKIVTYVKDGLK